MSNLKPAVLCLACLLTPGLSLADVDPKCDVDGDSRTDGYDTSLTSEAAQQWNLANATSLAMTLSPLMAPNSYRPFEVVVSLELNQLDYMTCEERTVLSGGKTEDTNKTPIIPRPRVTLGLPFGYVSIAGLPPAKLFGVRTGVLSVEAGGGHTLDNGLKVGARIHSTIGQVVGDIAHPFGLSPGDAGYEEEAVDDEYQFVNVGADVSLGYLIDLPMLHITPYVGAGVLRATSIFYVGEDQYEVFAGDFFYDKYFREDLPSEYVPGFAGLDGFAGVVARQGRIEGALEFFFIPVRRAMPDAYTTPEGESVSLYTADGQPSAYVTNNASLRFRLGYTFN